MFVTSGEQLLNAGFEGAYTNLQSEWTVIVNIPDTAFIQKKMEDNKCVCNNIFCWNKHIMATHTHSHTYTQSLSLSLTHTVSDAHTAGRYT